MAISASSYSVGNRVYRGGSSAPTQGTVDPSGYIDRELNNVASQQRSGLAQAALRRLKGPGASIERAKQSAGQSPYAARSVRTGPALPNKGGVGSAPPVATPALQMSSIGKLGVPDVAASASQGATGLPFDPEAADAQQQLLSRKNRFEQMVNDAQYGLERDYTTRKRTVEDEIPDSKRQLLESYAGRGLAYSSGYTHDYGDLSSQYANLLAELEQGKTEGLANLLRQRGMFSEEYATQLQNIQAAAARRLAEQAGDLGLGGGGGGGQEILDDLFGGAPTPYDNRYNQPTYNPNPASPIVAAPTVGGQSGVAYGPGRNIRPNPVYTPPAPTPTPVVAPSTRGISGSPFKRSWSRR